MDTLTTTEILEQVKKICRSAELKTKPVICRFLRFVVAETLEGRGDQLKGYTIGTGVFGKDKDFDPEQDSLVRIHAGRLRRLLRVYYLDHGKNDPIHIDIHKGGYHPIFSKRNLVADNTKISAGLYPIREPSVAVLPFKNLSGDPDKEYFAFGFSEELSIELTKYEDLKIVNCWHRPDAEISGNLCDRFGARFMIDGSLQMQNEEIRILIKVLDLVTGKQIWAERYNRVFDATNLIQIQEDIADVVAKTVGSEVGVVLRQLTKESTRVRPEKLEVFDAILQFYYYEANVSPLVAEVTFQKLQIALASAPTSGIIHAMIADMLGNLYALDYQNYEGILEKMDELVEKALALEPENDIVNIIYSFIIFIQNEKEKFLRQLNHCLSFNFTSPFRLGILGFSLALFGEWKQGIEILKRAMNRNIGYPKFFHGVTCLNFYRQSKFEEALTEAIEYDMPGLFWGPMLRIACFGKLGRKADAKVEIQQLLLLKPDFAEKAEYLISRFVKEDSLVNEVLDGLKKAGLKP